MKRAAKITIRFFVPAIFILFILVLTILPYVAKYYINEHGVEYSGRKMSVNQIRINYFTTVVRIIDFKMLEADGIKPFVTFDTLLVDIDPLHLFSSELVIEKIRLVKPEVTIIRDDTVFNFDDIVTFFHSKSQDHAVGEPSNPFKYIVKNTTWEKGKLTFRDKGFDHTTIMQDLGFTIPYISYNQQEASEAGLRFHFANGGILEAKAGYNRNKGAYSADFAVNQLDIAPFLPYVKKNFQFKNIEGIIDGKFHLDGNISNSDSIIVRADGNVSDFIAGDLSGRKVLGARHINVVLQDSYPMKFVFNMDRITLTKPSLFFEMKDSTNNFLQLMVDTVKAGPEANEAPSEYYYRINHLKIDSGLVDFRDNTYGEPFDYHLDQVSLKVDSISSMEKWVTAYSTMRLNKRGKLKAELGINPSDPYELKINYVVTNFQLSDLSIYSRYFVGFPILLGNMYYRGKTVVTARQLTSENKLIIRNAKLEKKSGGLMNIPLKLAIYLLKDIHGDIILDLALTGDLNNPKTKIGRLVWQTLKNIVIKVVATPFLALGRLMGVDPTEVKGIEFNYADTTLTNNHLRRIKLFTELERKKPDMKIELACYNDFKKEKNEIAVGEAGKLFFTATGADYKKEEARFTSFLANLAKNIQSDSISLVSRCIQLIGNEKLDSIQEKYTQVRINKIETALYAAADSTKIKMFVPDKGAPENTGSRPIFELKYSIDE